MRKAIRKKTTKSKKVAKTSSSKKSTKKAKKKTKKRVAKTSSSKKSTKKAKKKTKKKVVRTEEEKNLFVSEIDKFVMQIESLSNSFDLTMRTVSDTTIKTIDKFRKFMKQKKVTKNKEGDKVVIHIMPNDLSIFKSFNKEVSSAGLTLKNTPRIFFCSLVHHYDAYLGQLLRAAFYAKSELLKASEKKFTFQDLMSCDSIEDARESMAEREVESLIRESHIYQFDWMENRFGIPLRKDLPVWPTFVEITERRNLFVHCDGVVSAQYLSVCNQNGVKLNSEIKKGSELYVTKEYFTKSFECIFEIGVKLGQVVWRKLLPEELKKADNALHYITYELLLQERYKLAKTLLEFATVTLKRISSEKIRRMGRINLAIAHKFYGDEDACKEVLSSDDWSACGDEFKLAVAVLEERFDDAQKIMKDIGKDGPVKRESYASWPLFKRFRESKQFLSTYKKMFGEEFVLREDSLADKTIGTPLETKT